MDSRKHMLHCHRHGEAGCWGAFLVGKKMGETVAEIKHDCLVNPKFEILGGRHECGA